MLLASRRIGKSPAKLGPPWRVDQIAAAPRDDPGLGGWGGGFANQAHWDPSQAPGLALLGQTGPTWSAHCGAEVAASDPLGLCYRHRRGCLKKGPSRVTTGA